MSDNVMTENKKKSHGNPRIQGAGNNEKRHCEATPPTGLSSGGRDIPNEIRRRNKRTHIQIRRVCQCLDKSLGKLSLQEKAKSLVELILDKAKPPKNSQLRKEVELLKACITIFKANSLKGLDQLAQGKTAKVLVDTKKEVAYKLIEVCDGEVGGTFPNEIRIRPKDNQVLISGCKKHNLLKTIRAIEIANEHKGPVFTELAGFTEDGDLIICQPYIKDLKPIEMFDDPDSNESIELNKQIENLNMRPVGDIGSPFALAYINGKYAIFDDLHGENLLKNSKGQGFLVDALATRYLTPKEITLLKDFLPEKPKNRANITSNLEI
jgi:hypothetical protein